MASLHAQNNSADNPTGSAGSFNGNVTTGGCYDPYTGNAKRVITDLVVPGSCGAYPLAFTRTFNSNLEPTGLDSSYFGDGLNWRHSYQWSITPVDYSNNQLSSVELAYPDGSVVTYKKPGSTNPSYEIANYWHGPAGTSDRLEYVSSSNFILHTSDGGLVQFTNSLQATAIVDPNGATTTLSYASKGGPYSNPPNGYLAQVTEPGGRSLSFTYKKYSKNEHTVNNQGVTAIWLLLDTVTASTGQSVSYSYQSIGTQDKDTDTTSAYACPYIVLTGATYNGEQSTGGGNVTAVYNVTTTPDSIPQLSDAVDPHYAGAMTSIQYAYHLTANGSTLEEQNDGGHVGETVSHVDIVDSTDPNSPTVSVEVRGDKDSRINQGRADITRTFRYGGDNSDPKSASNAASFQLASITDFQGNTASLNYDPYGYVSSRQDFAGVATNYTNEPITGKVTSTIFPDGCTRSAVWTNKDDNNSPQQLYPYYLHSTTDERGNTTVYTHDHGSGLVTEIDYPDTGKETFAYQPFASNGNTFHKVSNHVTRLGATISYYYDGAGPIAHNYGGSGQGHVGLLTEVSRTYLDGSGKQQVETTQFVYDGLDRLIQSTDQRGVTDYYGYNARHQLTSITHAVDSKSRVYTYDDFGRKTSVRDELQHTTFITNDEYGRPVCVTQPVNYGGVTNRITYTTYDGRDNTNTVVADALSHTSSQFSYQLLPSGRAVQHIYSPNGWLTDEYAGQTPVVNTAPTYIEPSQSTNLAFNTSVLHTKQNLQYDPMGRLVQSTDAQGHNWSSRYDVCGRQISATDPLGHTSSTTYYEPTDQNPQPSCYGLVKTVQTPGNNQLPTFTTTYTAYDTMGRLTNWQDDRNPFSSTYDVAGDLTGQSDGATTRDGATTTTHPLTGYSYDQLGRKTKITYADSTTEQWSYDASGNMSTYQNRANVTQAYAYDPRNRPTGWTWNDNVTPSSTMTLDAAGRCTVMNNGYSALTMTYDDSNALATEQQAISGASATPTVTYTPDTDGNVYSVGYPSGDMAFWANLDYLARPTEVDANLAGGGNTQLSSYGYYPGSTWLQYQMSNAGVVSYYNYQANNRISSVSLYHQSTGQNISGRNYGYYPDGQLSWYYKNNDQSQPHPSGSALENGRGDTYSYWANGMLVTTQQEAQNVSGTLNQQTGDSMPGAATNPANTEDFLYDGAGNLTSYQNTIASANISLSYDTENRCNSSGSYYDANRNVTSLPAAAGNACTYIYNALNQLTTVNVAGNTAANFVYDPKGRLCQRTINGATTRLYYAGSQLVEERDSSNNKVCTYYYGAGGARVARVDANNVEGFYHYDARGCLSHVTDGTGAVLEQYLYSAFGAPAVYNAAGNLQPASTALGGNRALWAAGYEWYPEIGLYRCGARFYSPSVGRFMQPDPIGQKGGLNVYAYCQNDPVNGKDPSGLDEFDNLPVQSDGDDGSDAAPAQSNGYGTGFSSAIDVKSYTPTGSHIPDISYINAGGALISGDFINGFTYWGQVSFPGGNYNPNIAYLTQTNGNQKNVAVIIYGAGGGYNDPGNSNNELQQGLAVPAAEQGTTVLAEGRDEVQQTADDIESMSGITNLAIAGYSRGGIAAIELATILVAAGVTVNDLVTIDPVRFPGDPPYVVPSKVQYAANFYETNGGIRGILPFFGQTGHFAGGPVVGASNYLLNAPGVYHNNFPNYVAGSVLPLLTGP